jgi:hypothetical protein
MLAVRATTKVTRSLLSVVTSINAVAGFRKRSGAHPLAQRLKTLFFRQEDQAIPQPRNRKGRAVSEPEILAELFGDGKLSLLANFGRGQVFECGITRRHDR